MNLKLVFDATDAGGQLQQFLLTCMLKEFTKYRKYLYGMLSVNVDFFEPEDKPPRYIVFKNIPLKYDTKCVAFKVYIADSDFSELEYYDHSCIKPEGEVYQIPEPIANAIVPGWIVSANSGLSINSQYFYRSELIQENETYIDNIMKGILL